MALAPLATVADLEARGVTVDAAEVSAVNLYLNTASALVREAADSPVSETTSTITIPGERETRLRLPGAPIRSVSAVSLDGTAIADYTLTGGVLWRSCGWRPGYQPSNVTVTYVHGLPEVPADIVDLVCRLAGQALLAFRAGEAVAREVKSERIGDYSVTYADTESGTMALTDFQRNRLAARFGGAMGLVRSR